VGKVLLSACLCLSVCLSVCLFACIFQKPHFRMSSNFLYVFVVCGCGSVVLLWHSAVRYVLPVLWMTSRFHTWGSGPESNTMLCFIQFIVWRHWGEVCHRWLHLVIYCINWLLNSLQHCWFVLLECLLVSAVIWFFRMRDTRSYRATCQL